MYVYLIGNSEYAKIGIACNPEMRVEVLDTPMLPFEIKLLVSYDAGNEASQLEKRLHKRFGKARVRGEWFLNIRVADFIKAAPIEHSKCTVYPVRVKLKLKEDPRIAWAEERAIGERMMVFMDKLERNPRQC